MNEVMEELIGYSRLTIKASIIVGIFLVLCLIGASLAGFSGLFVFVSGALVGFLLALLNVFALGYAGLAFFLKKGSRLNLFLPILSFLVLILSALAIALNFEEAALGFACGLSSPLIFGFVITFNPQSPLDRRSL